MFPWSLEKHENLEFQFFVEKERDVLLFKLICEHTLL